VFPPGTELGDGGRYHLRRRIGIGGMAEVYKAADRRLGDRVVAVKTLSSTVANHPFAPKMRQLFIQEAQALSRVSDENVVDVLDFGVTEFGTPYMVMEFLKGVDLGVFLKATKRVAIDEAVDIILGVCAGVHACHLAGIIHRDLKPANVFLCQTLKGRQAKVLDFSVAKVPVAHGSGEIDQTRTDLIVGTPSYMSPEQALGRPANELSDQYSIGALLYRCLTGRAPQGVLPKPRDLRPEIPAGLKEAILRALDPTPAKRYGTVHELGQSLLPFTSAAGRGRWRAYYHSAPRPLDPDTTGSITRDIDPAQSAPDAATLAAAPYDFSVHERTTRLARTGDASIGPADTTIVDPPPAGPVAGPAQGAPSTVDLLLPTSVASPSTASTGVAPIKPAPAARIRDRAPAGSERTRPRIVAAFAGAAALVIAVTVAGAVHLRGRTPLVQVAPPPGLLDVRSDPPPAASPRPNPPTPPPPAPPPAPSVPAPSEIAEHPGASTPETPRRARHHEPRAPARDAIEYGSDGLPILH
jgi:serine/threonine-protein kinase